MDDFIMEFLDWFSDIWNSFVESSGLIAKAIMVVVLAALTMPVWFPAFVIWLVCVKRKDGESNG